MLLTSITGGQSLADSCDPLSIADLPGQVCPLLVNGNNLNSQGMILTRAETRCAMEQMVKNIHRIVGDDTIQIVISGGDRRRIGEHIFSATTCEIVWNSALRSMHAIGGAVDWVTDDPRVTIEVVREAAKSTAFEKGYLYRDPHTGHFHVSLERPTDEQYDQIVGRSWLHLRQEGDDDV